MTKSELFDFLDSEQNIHGLDSMATHGFLTATIVGQPLSNWMAALFDNQQQAIDDQVKQTIIDWQNDLLLQLKNEQPIELPFYGDTDNEEVDLSPSSDLAAWSVGFVDAMYAENAGNWFDDTDTEDDVAMLTLPMIVFSGIDEEDETLKHIRSDEDMLAQMVNKIEGNLTELFLLFHTND